MNLKQSLATAAIGGLLLYSGVRTMDDYLHGWERDAKYSREVVVDSVPLNFECDYGAVALFGGAYLIFHGGISTLVGLASLMRPARKEKPKTQPKTPKQWHGF
jgi:hypothetical protein